tara:strand:- start:517 stop:1353 length:837 start_codon:yes stop_codon:yes gene_type:complete
MAANEAIKGILLEKEILLEGGTFASNANFGSLESSATSWNAAKAPSGSPTLDISLRTKVIAAPSTPSYIINRSYLQFEIPFWPRISRFDLPPQLKIRCNTLVGDGKLSVMSYDYDRGIVSPWAIGSNNTSWDGTFTNSPGASYLTSLFTTFSGTGPAHATLDLNSLASFHCSTKRYILFALIDYTYDYSNNEPLVATNNQLAFDGIADTTPPELVLRKPWFIDKQGNEYPVDSNFTIRASAIGVNQRDRRVAQLPFGTAIKGPANLRQRNSTYQVTTS